MITILMATYNGEKYIRQQLDSLLRQTMQDFNIVVSDDGSLDSTLDILSEYEKRYPHKLKIINNMPPHGAKYNFLNLMIDCKDDYIMLCDQDDVWLENKIEHSLAKMKEEEARYGSDYPVLVHSDLCVVDDNLNVRDRSFMDIMNADYGRTTLKDQIIQNTLTGCTAMYNRALARLISEMPAYCVMHDWWLILIAAAFGRICPLYEQTILYRQHSDNEIGAKRVKSLSYLFNRCFLGSKDIKRALNETYLQAQSFIDMFGNRLSQEQITFLKDYVKIPKYGKIKRVKEMYRLGVRKNGFFRQIGQIIFG